MIMLTIAARELRSLFLSPLAWTLLAVVLFILAYLFMAQVDLFLQLQPRLPGMPGAPGLTEIVVAPVLGNAAFVALLILPLLTMRLFSDEMRNQTMSLLLSAPVSMTEIVLGKYLGVLGFIVILIALIALLPLSLLVGGALDMGVVLAALLGLFLLLAAFAAVGLFMSSLTAQPAVAAIATFGAAAAVDHRWAVMAAVACWPVDGAPPGLLKGAFSSADWSIICSSSLLSGARHPAPGCYRLQH